MGVDRAHISNRWWKPKCSTPCDWLLAIPQGSACCPGNAKKMSRLYMFLGGLWWLRWGPRPEAVVMVVVVVVVVVVAVAVAVVAVLCGSCSCDCGDDVIQMARTTYH